MCPQANFSRVIQAQRALRATFFLSGIVSAAWAPLVPFAKLNFSLSDGDIGALLMAGGVGSIVAMPLAAAAMLRLGSKTASAIGAAMTAAVLPLLVLAPSPLWLAAGLFLFGLSRSGQVGAANAHAVTIEHIARRPMMSSFHAFYSLGGMVGALSTTALLSAGFSPPTCLFAQSSLFALGSIIAQPFFLPKTFDIGQRYTLFAIPRGVIWWLGLFCFVSYLGEGVVMSWSANFLRFSRGFAESDASLAYAGFSATMMIMRLSGDRLIARFGPVKTLATGAGLAAGGLMLATVVPDGVIGIGGFMMMGLGAGNIVPIIMSAAGRLPDYPPTVAIPAITALGSIASLSGPAIIGLLSNTFTLATALFLVGASYTSVIAKARVVH